MIAGEDYLGGTWERYGDDPRKSNPEISGYFPRMAREALSTLLDALPTGYRTLAREINAAIDLL